jgi:RNA polymerase sigma-70 factor, ECF subfamily
LAGVVKEPAKRRNRDDDRSGPDRGRRDRADRTGHAGHAQRAGHAGHEHPVIPPPRPAGLDDCERVFERDFDYVYRTLQRFGVHVSDAEDLAQEVFLVVWRRRGDWDPSSSLRPWLAAIAFRMAIAHRRRSVREVPAGLVDTEDGGPEPDERLTSAAVRQLVLDVLGRLPPKQRAVLVMYELDRVPMKEVASALGLPVFTAYTRLRVARQRFAKELRRHRLSGRADAAGTLALPALCWDIERPVPEAPLLSRRRVRARLERADVAGTAGAAASPMPGGYSGGGLAVPAAAIAAATLLVAGIAWLALIAGTRASTDTAPRQAMAGPARPTAPAAQAPATRNSAARLRPLPAAVLATSRPPGAVTPEALARGVIGYWRFDDLRGSTMARDVSGNGGDCLVRRGDSAAFIDGVLGGAMRLAGGGWLECPSSPALQRLTTEITVAAWIRRYQHQRDLRTIVARQYGSGDADDFYFGLTFGRLIFASRLWGRLEVAIPQTLGQWVHVAAVRSQDGMLRLYVDGVEAKSFLPEPLLRAGTLAGTPYANPVLIGAAFNTPDPTWANQKFNGAIDELLLYERALAGSDVAALAAATQPRL